LAARNGGFFVWRWAALYGDAGDGAKPPVFTTVSDTVFRADGSPASGTLLISWPAFTTADGHTVAAGEQERSSRY
jgi:hypothetical protein